MHRRQSTAVSGPLLAAAVAVWGSFAAASGERVEAGRVTFSADDQQSLSGLLRKHCYKCHDHKTAEAGIQFEDLSFTIDSVAIAERWQKVLGVLNAGEMPPDTEPRPADADKVEVLAALSTTLAAARKAIGDQGRVAVLRRLNRREYANTLRDLLDLEVNVSTLPDDRSVGAFDTAGGSLFMSSDQFEQYLAVGRKAARASIERWRRAAEPAAVPQTVRREVEVAARRKVADLFHNYYLEGYRRAREWQAAGADPARAKEFGFPDVSEIKYRLGMFENAPANTIADFFTMPKSDEGAWLMAAYGPYHHTEMIEIPAAAPSGDYVLRLRTGFNPKVPPLRRFLEMGVKSDAPGGDAFAWHDVFQIEGTVQRPGVIEIPVSITADGPRTFLFREKRHADEASASFMHTLARARNGVGLDLAIWIDWVEWQGPITAPDDADRWQRLFGMPFPADADSGSARTVLANFAAGAFRGVGPEPAYIEALVAIYQGERDAGKAFADALVEPLAVILASPAFLYLSEPAAIGSAQRGDAVSGAEALQQLSALEVASRLSYFLWAGPPDDELIAAAKAGLIQTPEGVRSQATRMLADPRSFRFVKGFTHQWLGLDRLDFFRFDYQLYPDFDESTRETAKQEVYRTFEVLLRENLDARKLVANDFVVVNGLLASYYGLEDGAGPAKPVPVVGDRFRMIHVPPGSPRGGLLGMAAVLAMGSNGERTSPVERGAWVLRTLLNSPPPPAPPNVPQLSRLEKQPLSTRDRLRAHQEEPQCAQCHRQIDPIGFGLENFDAAGRWRTEEHLYEINWVMKGGPLGKRVTKSFPIDPAGSFLGRAEFKNYFELRSLVAAEGDDFLRGLIEHLYSYALGRPVSFVDATVIDSLVESARNDDGRLASIVLHIVATADFRTK